MDFTLFDQHTLHLISIRFVGPGAERYTDKEPMQYIKYYAKRTFSDDMPYVWCSGRYDRSSNLVPRTALPSPPTSDAAEISRQVKGAIGRKDRHDCRLSGWRTSLLAHVAGWEADGSITPDVE
jgi:hypothetical protein